MLFLVSEIAWTPGCKKAGFFSVSILMQAIDFPHCSHKQWKERCPTVAELVLGILSFSQNLWDARGLVSPGPPVLLHHSDPLALPRGSLPGPCLPLPGPLPFVPKCSPFTLSVSVQTDPFLSTSTPVSGGQNSTTQTSKEDRYSWDNEKWYLCMWKKKWWGIYDF